MALKQTVAPTLEPVTLAEARLHLHLDSGSLADDLTSVQSIAPGSHIVAAAYSLLGTSVEVLGYEAIVNLEAGTNGAGGTVDVKLQDSDNGTTWTDVTSGAFTQVTEANDNAVYEKAYTGLKAYIRAVATVATATCDFGVDVVTGSANTAEDTWLTTTIVEARQALERSLNRAFVNQTWELALDAWPDADFIELPYPPLSTVSSVTYYDTAQAPATFSSGDYIVDTYSEPGGIVLGYGKVWPSIQLRPVNGVVVRYVAGHGATASAVPERYRKGVLMLCGHLYEHREETAERALQEILMGGSWMSGMDRVIPI